MVGVFPKHQLQQVASPKNVAKRQTYLRKHEVSTTLLRFLEIFLEQQQAWQRRGEIVNLCGRDEESLGVRTEAFDQRSGLLIPLEALESPHRVVSHFRIGADAHALEVAAEFACQRPVTPCSVFVLGRGAGAAEPVVDVALVREQVLGLAQRFRDIDRRFKMPARFCDPASGQLSTSERKPGSDILSKRHPLSALPGLKPAAGQNLQSLIVSADLVQERAKLDGEIVALIDEVSILAQLRQPIGRKAADAFPQLIAFVEQSRVARLGCERSFVAVRCLDRIIAHVKSADAEIAPDDRRSRIKPNRRLPAGKSLIVTLAVIEKIA